MSVYVDDPQHSYGRMTMCHMIADTRHELDQMADAIGVPRKWFQGDASFPHYDICKAKRAEAVKLGAIEVSARELVTEMRRIRRHYENDNTD